MTFIILSGFNLVNGRVRYDYKICDDPHGSDNMNSSLSEHCKAQSGEFLASASRDETVVDILSSKNG